jgi:hypothetical protein
MQSAADRVLKALSEGHMITGFVEIPADKSSFKQPLTIQFFGFKVADLGYQLFIEKYITGQMEGELSKKHRRFETPEELALYVEQNYSVTVSSFTTNSVYVKRDFEVNRPKW